MTLPCDCFGRSFVRVTRKDPLLPVLMVERCLRSHICVDDYFRNNTCFCSCAALCVEWQVALDRCPTTARQVTRLVSCPLSSYWPVRRVANGVEWPVSSRGRFRRSAGGVEWPAASSGRQWQVTGCVRYCVEWPAALVDLRRRVSDCCLVAGGVEWPVSSRGRFCRSACGVEWPAASSGR
jgi:hypothetical protein